MHVIRLFYNRDLLKKITGMEQPPTNYNSFIKLWGKLMAAYMFASLPLIVIFLFSMKLFVKGLSAGAVKG